MQIQPPDNVLSASPLKPVQDAAESKGAVSSAVAAEVGRTFADVVQKALQACEEDPGAVQKAKQDLAEGRLETPEAFEQAARRILDLGI